MWKEILVDDLEDLKKYSDNVNATYCGNDETWQSSVNWLQNILKWKREAHCYFYEDDDLQICIMNKYDHTLDRIVNFQFFVKFLKVPTNTDKLNKVCAQNCKVVLERFNKIVRVSKYIEYFYIRDTGFSLKETTNNQIRVYNNEGITVTDFEKYWEYELM
ncbi:hypothetical protein LCGC14_1845390 [marine sediment metagenome]|uniref:Uncharacterized protein n=2 Tax=marine sediment metagenome TaxID=412755 RepID=A0A0F9GC86_9ZZZZ